MNNLDVARDTTLSAAGEPPCLSLYQTTYRQHPANTQDPIRFRNLVKTLHASLEAQYPADQIASLLKPFNDLAEDREFWNQTRDGLAVLGSRETFRVYRLQRPVADLAIVADSFHLKPLLRIQQAADRFSILGLNRDTFRLYEGNRDALDEIEPDARIPRTMQAALGDELTDKHQTVASYGGVGPGHSAMHHGLGSKEVEVAIDDERFFRIVDKGILEYYSQSAALPLILATLPEHRELFHRISRNPFLMKSGIDHYPAAMSLDDLRASAWSVVAPQIEARLTSLIEAYGTARARALADDDLPLVARAIANGQVATLLVEADREIPGRFDLATGDFHYADLASPQVDDLLDDMAESTIRQGGTVVVVPSDQMPSTTGVAAIYRFGIAPSAAAAGPS